MCKHVCACEESFSPPAVAVDEGLKTRDLLNILGFGIED